ncbi:MAG: hypothetical protein RLY11_922 [Bacteroidota bacterium]|jgi:two-component system, OmpR family, sensor histidine kinase CiaH
MRNLFDKVPLKFVVYTFWILLTYMVAALAWWYIELDQQNDLMLAFQKENLQKIGQLTPQMLAMVEDEHSRNAKQYIGEGLTFLGFTLLGAIFLFVAVRRQIRYHLQQKNFMMAVTHELKTPIAVTKLSLETLKRHQLEESKKTKIINEAINETERLDNLCNNILLSSQLDAGGYQLTKNLFNLSDVVLQSVDAFKKRYPDRAFTHNIDHDLFCYGEEFLIKLVINNILGNAVKYTQGESPIEVDCKSDGGQIEILVKDIGEGIPDPLKTKIFERFYRLEDERTRKSKGTGLGLYLSNQIIKDHDGKIYVKNNSPKGSVFTIQLPKPIEHGG